MGTPWHFRLSVQTTSEPTISKFGPDLLSCLDKELSRGISLEVLIYQTRDRDLDAIGDSSYMRAGGGL